MWRCDNVCGLGEHVTCHMLRFLSVSFLFGSSLEARLQTNIGFILRPVLTVLTRSAITPTKANRFG